MQIVLPILRVFVSGLLFLLGPFRTQGKTSIPKSGGVLVVANHLSDIDPIAVQFACARHIHFMAKSELFEMRGLGRIIRWFGAFPVKRGQPDRGAIKHAVRLLQEGKVVCVFPEGQLSEDGSLQPLQPGIVLMIRMANVPVICCGLEGTNRIMPYGLSIPRPSFGWVTAKWGQPKMFDPSVEVAEVLTWATSELERLST